MYTKLNVGFLLVIVSAIIDGSLSSDAFRDMACLLMKSPPLPCTTKQEFKIPLHLVETYSNLSLDKPQNENNLLDYQFTSLPPILMTLIPMERISKLDGSRLAKAIIEHPKDVNLAVHIVSSLISVQQKMDFLEKVANVSASPSMYRVLATVVCDLINLDEVINVTKNNFFMFLPHQCISKLNDSQVEQIFYESRLQKYTLSSCNGLTTIEIRIWAFIFLNKQLMKVKNCFLVGLTEEELNSLSLSEKEFKINFSIIQARTIFEKVYKNKNLETIDFIQSTLLIPKLTPLMLQKFNETDYLDLKVLPPESSHASAKQIMELIIANGIKKNYLEYDKTEWGNRIQYLKKWVYALPLHILMQYSTNIVLPRKILIQIQSDMLSSIQAYYLTNKGMALNLSELSLVMYEDTLLSALPTTQLLNHPLGSFNSAVLEHLLLHLPDNNNIPRMVSLLTKIAADFGSDQILPKLLQNKKVNSYFHLISSSIIKQNSQSILNILRQPQTSIHQAIKNLPPRVLSLLLRTAKKSDTWILDDFIDPSQKLYLLIRGLNCAHIYSIETFDFIKIIALYNQERVLLGKVFPKNLQYCCLEKLIQFLKLKMEVHQVDEDKGIISLLSPVEINAIGGYVILGLPTAAYEKSEYTRLIITTIGKLSVPELLTSVTMEKILEVADLALKYMFSSHFLTIFDVGNLIWFIHPTMFPKSSIDDLKLAIESDMLDKRLCFNSEKQDAWADLLLQIFGYPKSWNRGTLSTLGDLLLVFPDEILTEVNELLWIDAADTLQTKYYDTVEWIEPTPFVNVCINALEPEDKEAYYLGVKNLVKWRLVAVEKQLRTVSVASKNDLNLSNNLLSSETFDDSMHTDVSYGNDNIITTEETLYDDSEYEDDVTTYINIINELKTTIIEGDTTRIDEQVKYSKSEDSSIKIELNYTKTTLKNQETESTNTEHFTIHKNNTNIKKNKNISTTGYTPLYTSTRYLESSNFDTKIPFEQKRTTEIKEIININKSIIPTTENNTLNNESTILVDLLLTTNKINFPTPNIISQTTYKGLNIANATNQTDFIKSNAYSKFDQTNHENAPAYENRTIVSYPVLSPSKVNLYKLESIRKSTESMATTDDYKSNEEKDDMLKKIDEYKLSAIDISPRRRRRTITTLPDVNISCDALRVLGEVVSLFLSSVEIENIMSHSELNNCRDLLGKLDLPYESLKNIWGRLDEKIPTHLMGNLVKAAEVTDINIKNKEPWGLEDLYVYSQHISNSYLVGDLIEKLQLEDDLVNLNIETLAALNSLICNFDADIENISNIRAGFHDIIAIIGALPKCPTKCLPALAKIAVSSDGFGNINRWDVEDVETLGWIIAGLNDDQWNELIQSPKHLLTGVTPNTIRCLSSTKLKEIPYTVIYKLPPLTLEAIADNQLVELTNEQRSKVQDLKNLRIETNIMPKTRNKILSSDSSCNTCKESYTILIFIVLLICQLIINF